MPRFGRLLDDFASDRPAPGGGSAAAAAVALAAALLEKVAAVSGSTWEGAAEAGRRARELRRRGEELVEADEAAYLAYLAARRSGEGLDGARSRTVDVPLEIVRAGAEVAEVARELARHGKESVRPDASTAAILAHAALTAAAMLVEVNTGPKSADPRLAEARERLATSRAADLS